jgi:hypothetical protein
MNPHFRSQLAGTLIALATATVACDSPTAPTATPLPLQRETAGMRYYYAAGDTIDVDWQEAYNAWVIDRIGVRPPQPIEYYKYRSRADMGDHIGVLDDEWVQRARSIPHSQHLAHRQPRGRSRALCSHRPAVRLLQRRLCSVLTDGSERRQLQRAIQRNAGATTLAAITA